MFKILTSTEGLSTEEWLEYRRTGIGGSDASVVCGINRYKSPIELWMEKTDQWPNQEAGEAAYWGHQLESMVRDEFTVRTGIEVTLVKQILQSETHPFMLANLDGICQHPNYGTCVFEAKTASAYKNGEWDDAIPDEYVLQVQHYLAVTGYKGAFIAVLIGGNQFRWKFVERDEELIAMLIQLETEFWGYVQSNVPPSLDGSEASVKFLSERFPDSVPMSRLELPQEAAPLIEEYNFACEEIEKHTEKKQEAENLLKQMLGENEAGTVKDTIVTWKTITQERIDSKTLKSEHPKLFQKYANKTSYRRFSIKQAAI
jgi:putative phage-type endonuclease